MRKEREYKVIVKNPPTEEQKAQMLKRIEDYFSMIYSNQIKEGEEHDG